MYDGGPAELGLTVTTEKHLAEMTSQQTLSYNNYYFPPSIQLSTDEYASTKSTSTANS